jgi:serine/threonine protein kinase
MDRFDEDLSIEYIAALTSNQKMELALNMATSIQSLHLHNAVHRLVALSSWQVDKRSGSVFLGGFELCEVMTEETHIIFGMEGFITHMSPEYIQQHVYSLSVDVYAFGIVLSEVISNKKPFGDITDLHSIVDYVKQGGRPTLEFAKEDKILSDLAELAKNCWAEQSKDRPTIQSVVETLEKLIKTHASDEVVKDEKKMGYVW